MARVSLDQLDDPRFAALGILLKSDKFAAIGRMACIYEYCTERETNVITKLLLTAITNVENFGELMVQSQLAEEVSNGFRIKGCKGRTEWLGKLRRNGRKGGRPKKPDNNQTGTRPEPEANPITLTITPTITKKEKNIYCAKDFESLYQRYPRKLGKTEGIKICVKQIQTPEDFESLKHAINRFTNKVSSEATEPQYIPYFSTFMGRWRDYLDDDVGSVDAPPIGLTEEQHAMLWSKPG